MYYDPLYLLSGLAVSLVVLYVVSAFIGVVAVGAYYTSIAVVFEKANEKPWKSLIPFYNWYVFFKLCWQTKWFIVYIASYGAVIVGDFIFYEGLSNVFLGINAAMIIGGFITAIGAIASIVITIMLKYRISVAFGYGGGFTVGLVLLPLIFFMILAFGESKYRYGSADYREYGAQPASEGFLRCLSGDIAGASVVMEPNQSIVIGRDPAVASVVVGQGSANGKVSRRHCVVEYDGVAHRFFVTDESRNGVYFENGARMTPGARTALPKGSIIVLPGDIKFLLK